MAAAGKIETFDDFEKVHAILLAASGLPQNLHRRLFAKLSSETFDGGSFFRIEPCHEAPQRKLVLTSESMAKNSDVFLVDHAWTFRLSDAYNQLLEVPGLAERMASIMCVDVDLNSDSDDVNGNEEKKTVFEVVESVICVARETGEEFVRLLELDELNVDDDTLLSLDLPSKFPGLLALSLCGNKLENVEIVVQVITKFKELRGLWLNNNPVVSKCGGQLADKVMRELPNLEIYNSKFTPEYGQWALGFCGDVYDKNNPGVGNLQEDASLHTITSLDLSDRGIQNLNNKAFTPDCLPSLSHLNLRENPLEHNSTDDLFGVLSRFPGLHSLEVEVPGPLGESAVEILESVPNISILNGVTASNILEQGKHIIDTKLRPRLPEWTSDEPLTDRVLNAIWSYLMTYRLANEEKIDETSVLYVMDELGSALRHSDVPNFRVAPFLFMPNGTLESAVSFSILWPTQNVEKDDECTRDFLFGIGEDKQRSARLTAWFHTPENYFIQKYKRFWEKLQSEKTTFSPTTQSPTKSLERNDGLALRVYTDIPHVEDNLTRPEFIITTDPKDADIIWASLQVDEDTKKAIGITEHQFVNQFPFEACIVMKHHLADTIQKAYGSPEWLQSTYNLETNLSELIGDHNARKRDGRDNLWILKPWNMARTIDTTVTENLSAIIRLMETGPKICQKYIEHPALFNGKKFDLRYIVLVRSMQPLELFLSDIFWVRLANNPYSLDQHSLFEYETHFTVMNYRGRLNNKNTPEFVKEFEQEHQVKWLDIHERVKSMFRSVFEAAASVHPEMHSPTSRAIYGLDVMLDSAFQPKLLEVTYCPDCTRACKYDTETIFGGSVKGRDFFNNVFGCLFLNETDHVSQL